MFDTVFAEVKLSYDHQVSTGEYTSFNLPKGTVGTLVRETGNPANLHFVFKVSNSLTVVTPVQLNHVENINT